MEHRHDDDRRLRGHNAGDGGRLCHRRAVRHMGGAARRANHPRHFEQLRALLHARADT